MTWIYALTYWVWNGCKIKMFSLNDVAICEYNDDYISAEELESLKQLLNDFKL